ncbi:MAG: DegT/DnrJ/EryC1/StrS family aminotransferase [Candidatus Dojkabacteria bacterium]|nr:MAG: DegT/DnrJ/EryC1/StrS family aminotransferase [Candidatus Dojkabacteria bacterium]
MNRLIYTSYSPSTRRKDMHANLKIYFQPWKWKKGGYPYLVEQWFAEKYGDDREYFVYNYARSAMYQFFKALKPKRGDQVIFQGFTCIAAVNPAVWAGFKPVYADISPETLAFSVASLAEKITEKTKVIVYQHTLGVQGEIEAVAKLAKKHNIVLLEDCTHTLLTKHRGKLIGTYGDAAVFSFGRDKAISGVDGGVLVLNNNDYLDEVDALYMDLEHPTRWWVWKELNFPIFWSKFKFFYKYSPKVAKLFHKISMTLGLVTRATTPEEKSGTLPSSVPRLLPNALAKLAYLQLLDLEALNYHRDSIAKVYKSRLKGNKYVESFSIDENAAPLRFPALAYRKEHLLAFLSDHHIYLGDWYSDPISPKEANPKAVGYKSGECPSGEAVCDRIINLPTHINTSVEDANYIVDKIEEYYGVEAK